MDHLSVHEGLAPVKSGFLVIVVLLWVEQVRWDHSDEVRVLESRYGILDKVSHRVWHN